MYEACPIASGPPDDLPGVEHVFTRSLDVSNTGYISVSDLQTVMGEEYDEADIKKMMAVSVPEPIPPPPPPRHTRHTTVYDITWD